MQRVEDILKRCEKGPSHRKVIRLDDGRYRALVLLVRWTSVADADRAVAVAFLPAVLTRRCLDPPASSPDQGISPSPIRGSSRIGSRETARPNLGTRKVEERALGGPVRAPKRASGSTPGRWGIEPKGAEAHADPRRGRIEGSTSSRSGVYPIVEIPRGSSSVEAETLLKREVV